MQGNALYEEALDKGALDEDALAQARHVQQERPEGILELLNKVCMTLSGCYKMTLANLVNG